MYVAFGHDVGPGLAACARDGGDVDRPRNCCGAVVASQHEQPVDEAAQAGDVGDDRFDRGTFRIVDVCVEVLETEPERGEWRAELMRRVGDELLLRIEQPGDLGLPSD